MVTSRLGDVDDTMTLSARRFLVSSSKFQVFGTPTLLLLLMTFPLNAAMRIGLKQGEASEPSETKEAQYRHILDLVGIGGDLRLAYQESIAWKQAYPSDPRGKDLDEKVAETHRLLVTGTTEYTDMGENNAWWNTPHSAGAILFVRGKSLFQKNEYSAAGKYFAKIIESYPDDRYHGEAVRYMAECDRLLGNVPVNSTMTPIPSHTNVPAGPPVRASNAISVLPPLSQIIENWGPIVNGIQMSLSRVKGKKDTFLLLFRATDSQMDLNLGTGGGRMPVPSAIKLFLKDTKGESRALLSKAEIHNSGRVRPVIVSLPYVGVYGFLVGLNGYVEPLMASGYTFPSGKYSLTAKFEGLDGAIQEPREDRVKFWEGSVESGPIPFVIE